MANYQLPKFSEGNGMPSGHPVLEPAQVGDDKAKNEQNHGRKQEQGNAGDDPRLAEPANDQAKQPDQRGAWCSVGQLGELCSHGRVLS